MPLYEYENAEHGILVCLPFPVSDRPGSIVLKRRTVPSRVTIGTGAKPATLTDRLREGYKQLENRPGGLANKPGNLSTAKIKRALEMPD